MCEKNETIEEIFDDCRYIASIIKSAREGTLLLIQQSRPARVHFVKNHLDIFYNNETLITSSNYKAFRDIKEDFNKLYNEEVVEKNGVIEK